MEDKPPIHIESKVTTVGARADPGDHTSGPWSSTNRVVRTPGRWSRVAGVIALVGLLAGGLLWWANNGEGDDDGAGELSCGIGGDRVRAARIATVRTHRGVTVEGRVANLSALRRSAAPIALGPTAVLKLHTREEAPDAARRCDLRATVPAADRHDAFDERLVGPNLQLDLDEDGNIARIVVRSAPDSELVLEFDTREGEPQAVVVAPPDNGR